jgi:hypothetical protein
MIISLFAYRPGEPIGDYFIYFDHAPGAGREGLVGLWHVVQVCRNCDVEGHTTARRRRFPGSNCVGGHM